mgnify:CR=1 FL=1
MAAPTCRLLDSNKKCGCKAGYVLRKIKDTRTQSLVNECGGYNFPDVIIDNFNSLIPRHYSECCTAHDLCYSGLDPIMKDGIVELDDAKQTPFLSEIDSNTCDTNMERCQLSHLRGMGLSDLVNVSKLGIVLSWMLNTVYGFSRHNMMASGVVTAVTCEQDQPGKICMYDEATLTSKCDATRFPQLRCNNDPCTGETCGTTGKIIFYDVYVWESHSNTESVEVMRHRYHGPADLIHRLKRLHDEKHASIDEPNKINKINKQIKTLESNPLLRRSTRTRIRPSRVRTNIKARRLLHVVGHLIATLIALFSPVIAYMNLRGSTSTWFWFLLKYACLMFLYVVAGVFAILYLNIRYRDVEGCIKNPGWAWLVGGGIPCDNLSYNEAQRTWTCWDVPCGLTKEETNKLESMIDQCHLNGSCDTIRGLLEADGNVTRNKTNIDCKRLRSLIKHGFIS